VSVANIVALVLGSSLAAALVTTWLGHLFQTSREDRRWKLDKKLAAYLEYLGALADYEAFLLGAREQIAPAEAEWHKAAILRYVAGRGSLALIASNVVLEKAAIIEKKSRIHLDLINAARENNTPMPAFLDLQRDMTDFVAAAREDLGVGKADSLSQVVSFEPTPPKTG
jgi:hypothetical protein